MEPLISIIIPSYNHENFIEKAFSSVFEQTYKNIELIIIDDNSNDSSYSICKKFAESAIVRSRFKRLEILSNKTNSGAHSVLNTGIDLAEGKFITFLNSDDFFGPQRISQCVEASMTSDNTFVFTGVASINNNGELIHNDKILGKVQKTLGQRSVMPSLSFGFLGQQLTVSTGNMFLGAGLLAKVGKFSALRYCHDWDMALRLISLVEPIFVQNASYFYRQHATNSYKGLEHVADGETEVVLRRYVRSIKLGGVINPLAPSPIKWPGVFEIFAKRYGTYRWWAAESGAYAKDSRVVDRDADIPRV